MAEVVSAAVNAVKEYSEMPSPPSGALGHLHEWLGVDNAERVLDRLHRYATECGPVTRVKLGPARLVFVSDLNVAAEVLADERANYKGAAYIFTRAVLDNVLLLNGDAWANARQTYRQALRGVDVLGPAQRHSERIDLAGDVSLDHTMLDLVGRIVGDFVAGVELPREVEPDRALIQYELAALGIDLQCAPWSYLSPLRWWRIKRSVARVRAVFATAVEERLTRPDPTRRDVLNGFIAMPDYPCDELQEGVVNFFFTAHEVVASTTAWLCWLLATHPSEQQRARTSDAYLDAVLKESLRLFPGYSLFGRTTREEMPIAGYRVPKGAFLVFSPYVTHRLERFYPNAHVFDPDRVITKEQYFPFGAGARGCLAQHLALPMVKTIVKTLIDRYELTAARGHEPAVRYWGTAFSKNGLPVTITPLLARSSSTRDPSLRVAL